ncbi:mechanosensitive ion channel domain-containing protein [Pontiella sulfatireligans]|uniref:Mechanosensitive channel MscK n=1 Tax=Pontiella sulfatireligans TaxID=2750658 RepID=A0A6C2UL81_9BACT|nr:mechanosensitive ion channel domain-containing protein [Pontiella sulfatireligans]VGO20171.1 Mechanosensitive channel MscK [Pontiella sulfatireligans]
MRLQIILFALLLFSCNHAKAQTNAPVSGEQIKALVAAVQNNDAIEPVRRQALLKQLEQADAYLDSAAQLTGKATKMTRDLQQASATIEAINTELKMQEPPLEISATDAANLAGLEQQQLQVEAKVDEARRRMKSLEAENQTLTAEQTNLPKLLAVADARQGELQQMAAIPPTTDETLPSEDQVHQSLTAAELQSARAQVNLYQMELKNYDTLKMLLSARIDQATRHLGIAEAQSASLREAVDRQRRIESEAEVARADQARLEATLHHSEIQAIAKHNAELAALRAGEDGLTTRQRNVAADLQTATKINLSTQQRSKEIEERIQAAGLTHAVAQLLSRERSNLPDLAHYKPRARARKKEIALAQLALLDFSDQREELRDISASVKLHMEAIGETPDQAHIAPLLTEYLTTQRNQLDTLISEYNSYFNLLVDLDTAERLVVESVAVLADDIAEHILWIRSDTAFGLTSPRLIVQGFAALAKGSNWKELAQVLRIDLASNPFLPALLLAELLLIAAAIGVKRRLKTIAGLVAKIRTDRFFYTFEALFYTVLRALPLPLPLFYLAWRIGAAETSLFSSAFGQACYLTGLLTLCCSLLLQSIGPSGLVETHFGADKNTLKRFRQLLIRLMVFALPVLWLTTLIHHAPEAASDLTKPFERLCYMILQLMIARFAYCVFCRQSTIMKYLTEHEPNLLIVRFRALVFCGAVGIPLIIMLETVIGFYYTALQMSHWFAKTLGLVFVLALIEALLIRGIQVVARKAEFARRVRERQELQELRNAAEAAGETELPIEPAPAENDEMNFITLNENTRKLMTILFGFGMLFGMWFIWSDAVPALGLLDRVVLWNVQTDVGGAATTAVSLANLAASLIIFVLTFAGARHLPSLLELAVLRQLRIAYGERYAISMVVRYMVVAIGVSVGLSMLGIGWSKFKWLAAALSVGLGFGLQEIFANFISGLILLFERPIRVRDYVTVNGTSGQVTRIQIRATTITDWDNKELLIPNKQFVTGELVNWTLTNSILRIVIPVGVAYGSDTQKVESVLLGIARSFRLSVADPEPNAFFTGFGESSLNFELRVFIAHADQFRLATHELNMAVDAAFREAGIVIAFPQLDVHMQPQAPASPTDSGTEKPEQK